MWCRCHTPRPRPMPWWIYIQYGPIPSLCNSGGQWICSHHPQYCPFNQARVTVAWFAKILCILRVVEVVWCRCHTPRPMTGLIYIHYGSILSLCNSGKKCMCSHHPKYHPSTQARVTVAWVYKNGIYRWWLKWGGAVAITQGQGPCHGGFISNMDLHQVYATLGINGCAHVTLSIVHSTKQGSL